MLKNPHSAIRGRAHDNSPSRNVLASVTQRFRSKLLRLALLQAVEKGDESVDDTWPVRLRRDIGSDEALCLNAQRYVSV